MNAYLTYAAMIGAGLYGIEHGLELVPEYKGNGYVADGRAADAAGAVRGDRRAGAVRGGPRDLRRGRRRRTTSTPPGSSRRSTTRSSTTGTASATSSAAEPPRAGAGAPTPNVGRTTPPPRRPPRTLRRTHPLVEGSYALAPSRARRRSPPGCPDRAGPAGHRVRRRAGLRPVGRAPSANPQADKLAQILDRGTLVGYAETDYPPQSMLVEGATRPAGHEVPADPEDGRRGHGVRQRDDASSSPRTWASNRASSRRPGPR